ncbi:MAG TPA: PD-(D/E)XK nuclease family protein [Kofleriaceae bacterium]|jgi:hypothetical protein|nr:PD-(D/E)XK nuclease family protein [Kofleriaceae bacterium]
MSANEATLRAVESLADAVRHSRRASPERQKETITALEHIASATRTYSAAAIERCLAALNESLLQPIDPSDLTWSVFRLFGVSNKETSWTTWLAGILNPDLGSKISALVWRAFCDAVVRHAAEPIPWNATDRIATLANWCAARDAALPPSSLDREDADGELGRTDITVRAPGIFAIIENKLDASWHDGDGEPQAVRYRKIGLKRRSQDQRLGLVVLTRREDFELKIDRLLAEAYAKLKVA